MNKPLKRKSIDFLAKQQQLYAPVSLPCSPLPGILPHYPFTWFYSHLWLFVQVKGKPGRKTMENGPVQPSAGKTESFANLCSYISPTD
ncbi:hypothetical protein FKM82_011853 [Ascaphus truei]